MKVNLPIDIPAIEQFYRIEEDGSVFSLTKQRYLRAIPNTAGHLHVCLHQYIPNKLFQVRRVVAAKYNGVCPEGKEAVNSDGNKWNNHFSNIAYKTHAEVIIHSFQSHNTSHIYNKKPQAPESYNMNQPPPNKRRCL